MEEHHTSLSNVPPSRRPLHRSWSVQPEDTTSQGLSPYPSKRKSKNPGRSLTEIFTPRARANSSDPSVSLRRRTLTAALPVIRPSVLREGEGKTFLNRSFSDVPHSSLRDDGLSVCGSVYGDDDDLERESVCENQMLIDRDLSELKLKRTRLSQHDEVKSNKLKGNDVQPSYLWQILKTAFKIVFWFIIFILFITLLVLGFSVYFAYEKSQCDLKKKVSIPFDELNRQLSTSVIGQDIAVDLIMKALKDFQKNKINSPLIVWMVGWSGSGKTHTTNILRNVLSSMSRVFTVIPSLYPQHKSELFEREVYDLYNQLDPCAYNVILIDGWDEDNIPLQILKQLILKLKTSFHSKYGKGKTVIVLSGIKGSQLLNTDYLNLHLIGKKRQDLLPSDFAGVTGSIPQIKEINDTLKSVVFVPFLPMEAKQVRECILGELSRLGKSGILVKDVEQLVDEVTEQLIFIPPSHPIMAATGCKRVQPLLKLLLIRDADVTL